ncbi:MAG: S-methyl-5-thioribose-1-phosphate isomerase [Eubacteriales bacterium]|nr:S-methyl-5-thioribose-1-phosphate isomerase [Eubacteriales bacterium]
MVTKPVIPFPDTVALDDVNSAAIIIDQTLLPGQLKLIALHEQRDIWEAIRQLKVRGAPAIGVMVAMGLYLAAKRLPEDDEAGFFEGLTAARDYLASSRPTAVNLFWVLDRMVGTANHHRGEPLAAIKRRLLMEARAIRDEDIAICEAIGLHGAALISEGDGVLTHCNAGRLAAVRYGTALAPLYKAHEAGKKFMVYADETRPLLQGARLTGYELLASGIDVTLLCDSMAASLMRKGVVRKVFVGCDRVAANGDACNKIGTLGLAILARHYGIPFYVCAPTPTVDMSLPSGEAIPIEERPGEEVTAMWYGTPMAPEGVKVYNPAFDVTPHRLITAFITQHGLIRPPFARGLARCCHRPVNP